MLICFGTRPEWLKIKPLLPLLGKYTLLFTGQHTDLLNDIQADYVLKLTPATDNRLNQIISDCISQFPDKGFDSVLVQGDTASALACALAAFNKQKKIYYLEAGLRTFNLQHPYPEEGYRQLISRISDVNFCPTELSKNNLLSEKVNGECHVVGNTSLDNIKKYKDTCHYGNIILITLHRRENHSILAEWFTEINNIAAIYKDYQFVLPIHPNPNVIKHQHLLSNVTVLPSLSHEELLQILIKCSLVITDSGGLQEECSFLNKKCLVCRETTERPEALELSSFLVKSPTLLRATFDHHIKTKIINFISPYGDGTSSQKIINIINNEQFNSSYIH